MHIDFDEYPPYIDTIPEIFETNLNDNIQCDIRYTYSSSKQQMCTWVNEESWEGMKKNFLMKRK